MFKSFFFITNIILIPFLSNFAFAECTMLHDGKWQGKYDMADCFKEVAIREGTTLKFSGGRLSGDHEVLFKHVEDDVERLILTDMAIDAEYFRLPSNPTKTLSLRALATDCTGYRELVIAPTPCGLGAQPTWGPEDDPMTEFEMIKNGLLWDQSLEEIPKFSHSVEIRDSVFYGKPSLWTSKFSMLGNFLIDGRTEKEITYNIVMDSCLVAGDLVLSVRNGMSIRLSRCVILGDLVIRDSQDVYLNFDFLGVGGDVRFENVAELELANFRLSDIKGDFEINGSRTFSALNMNYVNIGGDVNIIDVIQPENCKMSARRIDTFGSNVSGSVTLKDSKILMFDNIFNKDSAQVIKANIELFNRTCD